jgi:Ca-activated chloride channel family protein
MSGESIQQATAALELCLRSLSEGDTFNICKFGSRFELMASEPVVYNDHTLKRAIAYVRKIEDLGGTELLQPLEAILRTAPVSGRSRSIVLLTDGQVTNEPAILDLARRHRSHNRIFSFGIGPACSSFLVKGLARATGGAAEFIAYGERIETKVLRTFARLASPIASEVQIDWGGADVQTLAELPPVFDGEVMTVYGRALGTPPKSVSLKCETAHGPKGWAVAVPPAKSNDHVIATMWARRMIQSLEEVNGVHRSAHLTNDSRERRMLIELSKEFGLLSSLTTYIAIEHRSIEERNDGQPATRRVPVMLASGWGELAEVAGAGCKPATLDRLAAPAQAAGAGGFAARTMPAAPKARSLLSRLRGRAIMGRHPAPPPAAAADSDDALLAGLLDESVPRDLKHRADTGPTDPLHRLLATQSAAGAFELADEISAVAKSKLSDWEERHRKFEQAFDATFAGVDKKDRPKAVATTEGLILLRTVFARESSVWKRAADKAIRYLAKLSGRSAAEIENWMVKLLAEN